MSIQDGLFSSECPSAGHPDKLADRISDAVLDQALKLDPAARIACKTWITESGATVTSEYDSGDASVMHELANRVPALISNALRGAGHAASTSGIDPDTFPGELRFSPPSPDGHALVFGYASAETPELMPAPILYAQRLMRRHAHERASGTLPWLGPDARAQVTFRYEDGMPASVESVTLSTQHTEQVDADTVRAQVTEQVIDRTIPQDLRSRGFRVHIVPRPATGLTVGLTGRHSNGDTYGGFVPSAALAGEGPLQANRCGTYMARYLARQVVARGWARRCLIQIAYAAGVADPASFLVQAEGASAERNTDIAAALRRDFDLSPAGIIRQLNLRRPIYYDTAAYGHFGRDDLPLAWEQPDRSIPFQDLDIAGPGLPANLPRPKRAIEPAWDTIASRSPRRYPYLVVRFMNAVYQREEIAIHKGEAKARVGYRDTFVHHPQPFDADGTIGTECRQLLAAATLQAIRRTGFRMCLVWSANSCTFVEKDGSCVDSDDPPSGGFGSGGVGGTALPANLQFDVKQKREGRRITPFDPDTDTRARNETEVDKGGQSHE